MMRREENLRPAVLVATLAAAVLGFALRLWQLRDVAIIGVAFLLSVLALAQTGTMLPLVGTVLYAFLAIQVEGSSVLDFLRRAACFLFLQQQYYKWGQNNE